MEVNLVILMDWVWLVLVYNFYVSKEFDNKKQFFKEFLYPDIYF